MVFRRSKLGKLLARLADSDDTVRFAALDELEALDVARLSERELVELLEAAGADYPPHRLSSGDIAVDLVLAAAQRPIEQHIAVAEHMYPNLSDGARRAVLMLLSSLGSRAALKAVVNALRAHGAAGPSLRVGGPILTAEPAHGDILFPALLEIAADGDLLAEALVATLAYARAGELPDDGARAACAAVERVWPRLRAAVLDAACGDARGWCWADEYQDCRILTGLALDVAGRIGGEDLDAVLLDAMTLPDPRLARFAIAGALRHGLPPDSAAIERAAARPEARFWLYETLDELDRLDLLPERHRTQPALAEAELAQWLTYPTELGREPDEIELMEVVPLGEGDEALDLYVFRFRTLGDHWSAAKGWLAGVAGPYPRGGPPSTPGLGLTFSVFEAWDSATPAEHAQAILGTVDDVE